MTFHNDSRIVLDPRRPLQSLPGVLSMSLTHLCLSMQQVVNWMVIIVLHGWLRASIHSFIHA